MKMMLCQKANPSELSLLSKFGKDLIAEIKYDGVRARLNYVAGRTTLHNRTNKDVTNKYPELQTFTCNHKVLLDGELIVLNGEVSAFNEGIAFRMNSNDPELVKAMSEKYPVIYMVFDLLELDGENLRSKPLKERRKLLESLKMSGEFQLVHQNPDLTSSWTEVIAKNMEGIIVKNLNSQYREGFRSSNWKKIKNVKEKTLTFTKYTPHSQGVRVVTNEGIAITVNGHQSITVSRLIDTFGRCDISIRHLGKTESGRYRQPVFHKIEEGGV